MGATYCMACGQALAEYRRSNRRYCSGLCRVRAFRIRVAGYKSRHTLMPAGGSICEELGPARLLDIRLKLNCSQEQIARLLCVSFATVNRWERGRSMPAGTVAEVYRALAIALKGGSTPVEILGSGGGDRGMILHRIFQAAYGTSR